MKKFFREHWKKMAGWTCAAGVAVLEFTPYKGLSAPLGLLCAHLLTDDYHEGQRAVEVANPVIRAVRDALVLKKKRLPPPLPPAPGSSR